VWIERAETGKKGQNCKELITLSEDFPDAVSVKIERKQARFFGNIGLSA
jgi:hypothetical protein